MKIFLINRSPKINSENAMLYKKLNVNMQHTSKSTRMLDVHYKKQYSVNKTRNLYTYVSSK